MYFLKWLTKVRTRTSKNSMKLTWNKPRANWLDLCTGIDNGIPAGNEELGLCSYADLHNDDCPRDTDSDSEC